MFSAVGLRRNRLVGALNSLHASRIERLNQDTYTLPNGPYGLGLSSDRQAKKFCNEIANGSSVALALARARCAGQGLNVNEDNVYPSTRRDAENLRNEYRRRYNRRNKPRKPKEVERLVPRQPEPKKEPEPLIGGMKAKQIQAKADVVKTPVAKELSQEERRKIWQPPERDVTHQTSLGVATHTVNVFYESSSSRTSVVIDDTEKTVKKGKHKRKRRKRKKLARDN